MGARTLYYYPLVLTAHDYDSCRCIRHSWAGGAGARSAGAQMPGLLNVKTFGGKYFEIKQVFRNPLHILAKHQTRQALHLQSLPGLFPFSGVKLRIPHCKEFSYF
jgi:hypothetical protein